MKKLLILDLDETLIYATQSELSVAPDFEMEKYIVYKRPYVDEFLDFCFEHFQVAVWTSSSPLYAEIVVNNLFKQKDQLQFVWASNKCVQKFNNELWEQEWIKDLNKVKKKGYPLDSILMVDDTPSKLRRQYGNLIPIRAFEGDQEDQELRYLQQYLLDLKDKNNIRKIEKRAWRLSYLSDTL